MQRPYGWHVALHTECASAPAGTGNVYSVSNWQGPGIWNYTQAVEADSQFFYSGVPWDMVGPIGSFHKSFRACSSALHERGVHRSNSGPVAYHSRVPACIARAAC